MVALKAVKPGENTQIYVFEPEDDIEAIFAFIWRRSLQKAGYYITSNTQ